VQVVSCLGIQRLR